MSIWEYANPKRFMQSSAWALPWMIGLTVLCLVVGLVWGFFFTPDDYKQGSTVKIIYLHVPSAMMAINAWVMMLVASLIWIVRRHHVSALAAKAAAPVGLTFTLIALATGALWQAIEDPDTAADLTAILCLVGSVFALLSRYAVNFWNQGLHQGATLSLDKEENISDVFWLPLLICIAGFVLLFVTLVLMRTRTEIRARRLQALLARERVA
ncbi:MAG: transcriptional regulator [Rhodobacterales bacterium]|nr:MAG: transcriptional regulator [Rhodobacterales bacterium]